MTREELFRAVGEVREDQIEEAESMRKLIHPWRRVGALAACLALIVTAATAAPWFRGQVHWRSIIGSFNPGIQYSGSGSDSGASTGVAGDVDGCDYWTEDPDRPLRPDYSINVEIGELAEPGDGETTLGLSVSACLVWLSPEEIFARDTAIFRGTVREMQYYVVTGSGPTLWYTRAIVEVTDPIQGGLEMGETVSLLWPGAKGYMSTSISGPLDDIAEGSDAIFMPAATDRYTGQREGDSYFCYADLADYYLSEGMRFVFLDTEDGLSFDRDVYAELSETAALDDVAAYIRRMIGNAEHTQPAVIPAAPQEAPSKTAQAEEPPSGPDGARELPDGAVIE